MDATQTKYVDDKKESQDQDETTNSGEQNRQEFSFANEPFKVQWSQHAN